MMMTLQSGSKFHVHTIMALMVMMTLLLTSNAFTFHSIRKPSQGTTTIAPTQRCTQQILLMSLIIDQKPRKSSARNHFWHQKYLELKEFYQKFGNTDVPQKYPDNPQLGLWVREQRQRYRKGKLSAERIRDLEDISFRWVVKTDWEQRYLELKEFYQKFGNTDVPQRYPTNPQLGHWVHKQRYLYKNGKLSAERIRDLEDIGFCWVVKTDWEQRYLELKEFYQQFGHLDVPNRYPDNPQLGHWVDKQRYLYKKGKLSAERIHALDYIGFHWGCINPAWEQRYLELKEFYQQFGRTNVPRKYPANPQLGHWVRKQRELYKRGELSEEKIHALEDIGFNWGSRRTDWEQRYLELKEFYQKFGHTDIPQRYPDNPQLGGWVHTQRQFCKNGKLSEEQIRALEDIGFHWVLRSRKTVWEQRYLELKEFYQKFGHTDVPENDPDNPQLGEWVHKQHIAYKKRGLSVERIRALEDIGFGFDNYTEWEQMYLNFEDFHQEFGHPDVPQNYTDNPLLGEWTHKRRTKDKNGKLTAEHKRALVDLDFKWNFRSRRTHMYVGPY